MKQVRLSLMIEHDFQVLEVSMSPHGDQTYSKDDMSDCLEEKFI